MSTRAGGTQSSGDSTGKRGRAATYAENQKIKVIQKTNPKREGSAAHARYELYLDKATKTVGDFINAGGSHADLKNDVSKGFIEVN